MERWLSGLKHPASNRAGSRRGFVGSNPTRSAELSELRARRGEVGYETMI
jgi:hypothetical protein